MEIVDLSCYSLTRVAVKLIKNNYYLVYLPAGLDISAARKEPVRGAPSMNADQGDGWEGDAGTFVSEPPDPSQKYAVLSIKPLAIHASTIKCRIFPTEAHIRISHIE